MQNEFDTIFPPAPDSYYDRMEAVLAGLPEKKSNAKAPTRRRTVPSGGFTQKQMIALSVAVVVLLAASTALAVGISIMQRMRDKGLERLDAYTSMVQDSPVPTDAIPADVTDSDYVAYVPVNVGMQNEEGAWQPLTLKDLDMSATVGTVTVQVNGIHFHAKGDSPIYLDYSVACETRDPYSFGPFFLSINGGEPIQDSDTLARASVPSVTPTPAPYEAPYADEREQGDDGLWRDSSTLRFKIEENPFLPDTTFTVTSTLNGEPFTLTYTLTAERFEAMRQENLTALENYAALLKDIPADPIPVGAECAGYRVVEIALQGHWLYHTVENVPAYWAEHPSGRESVAVRGDGFYPIMDGMICPEFEFISSEQDSEGRAWAQLFRVWLPYGDTLPTESLLVIEGAPFRIEWATGKVTLPKDEAEQRAWQQESDRLTAEGGEYDFNRIAKPAAKADTFTASEIVYMNRIGMDSQIGVILETDEAVQKPFEGKERQPVITFNGLPLEGVTSDYNALDSFCGGTENKGKRVGFCFYGPALRTLPDAFEVKISWNGSETAFTLHKSDFAACYGESDWEQFGKAYAKVFGI